MSKKTNDQIILDRILRQKCEESEIELSLTEYFEIYTASEILKNHELTYDDITYGIVADGGDGGIDSIYTFLNGELIKEDSEINSNQKKNQLELIIIQSKTSASFGEDAIIKFRETAQDLFDLANNIDDFSTRYNSELLERIKLFRDTNGKILKTFPKLSIKYYYVTQGDHIHPNVEGKVPKLKADLSKFFTGAEISFEFIGASKLLEMAREVQSSTRILEVAEQPIGTKEGSYVCLVSLTSYFEFISDQGRLAKSIFESNVRDYQGSVAVNTGIRKTLENKKSGNFYLNNGVTIITPKAVLSGRQLTIEDPQIVNGLQTSYEIYQHFSSAEDKTDNRAVLVRVITEDDETPRDRIIRATNSQTSIPPASLRSSD